MSNPLERVTSVKQTSTASTGLPLELQQQVFSYLDTKSFYSARRVCRWWHFASTGTVPLAKQLRRLPLLPPVHASDSNPAELQMLFERAAHTLMLGVKSERGHDEPGSLTRAVKMGLSNTLRTLATEDGEKTVSLVGRTISVFDTSDESPNLIAQRPLNDLKETVGSGPWLKVQQNPYYEMALSSNGTMLAVAQERTIQIYDLLSDPDSFTVNEYLSSASGHYICGLDFEQNDHVLRVRLSGKAAVLYLGTPPGPGNEEEKATMEHWRSRAGLKHTFLDSALLQIRSPSKSEADQLARISGVQLIQPFEGGCLFAGQRHGGGESSHYILGHVKTRTSHDHGSTVEHGHVTVLARLESFLSSWEYTLEASSEGGLGLWENMPSAHEHHPRFAMTHTGNFLAIAERDKKKIRPAPLTQLFIYRIPNETELRQTLARHESEVNTKWAKLATFLDKLELPQRAASESSEPQKGKPGRERKYKIPRIPLCLCTMQNDVTELRFMRVDRDSCTISATTVETKRTWLLRDL